MGETVMLRGLDRGLVVAGALWLTAPVMAEETNGVTYLFGIDLVSNYVSNGVTQSDGKPAIQPYFEIGLNSFYVGTWMSNVDFGDDDDWEIDLYLGWRKLLANDLYVDLGYARYIYDASGDCCGEIKLTLNYPLGDQLGVTGYLAYDPVAENLNRRMTLDWEPRPDFGIAAEYGYSDSYAHEYWNIGASYTFGDYWSVGLGYEGAGRGDEGLVLRLSLGNLQTPLARLLAAPFQPR
jgi:uncharacterized protein (TIGR02001 family)